MNRIAIYTAALAAICALAACDNTMVFEANKNLADRQWRIADTASFTLTVTDTVTPHNIYINVRNTDNYKFSNLCVFLETSIPDGHKDLDSLECIIADDHGKWLGNGLGDLFENRILFAKHIRFKQLGKYNFVFTHAMRVDPLTGIADFGMRVERSK